MDPLRQYEIAFVGLKTGEHHFQFTIDDKFFELFENSLVKTGLVDVRLTLDKRTSFLLLNFILEGSVKLGCDRCGADLNFPVDAQYPIVVKFDHHDEGEKDDSMADVVYISRSDSHLDVSQLIYEFINLSIPLNHVTCENLTGPKPCNEDVLRRLKQPEIKKITSKDPRWDNLSKIKFN
jgi:uncharacterized metal-binding protein YceD (DUF177 family)